MNDLIRIEEKDGQQVVNARDLHSFLKIETRFDTWFNRMCDYGFEENKDYIMLAQKRASNELKGYTAYNDYILKISMAKEISMIQRNERGKQAREYFIKCEEAWNSPEMILARAQQISNRNILSYKEKIAQLETTIIENRPKVVFADAVATAGTSILIGDLAKLIRQNGFDIGQNRLFEYLRENGYLIKRNGDSYNMPTQASMDKGLFEIKERSIIDANGANRITKTTKVTGKGQIYFINLFKSF